MGCLDTYFHLVMGLNNFCVGFKSENCVSGPEIAFLVHVFKYQICVRLQRLVVLLCNLGFNFITILAVCQIWNMWGLNMLSTACYGYDDWLLKGLLNF